MLPPLFTSTDYFSAITSRLLLAQNRSLDRLRGSGSPNKCGGTSLSVGMHVLLNTRWLSNGSFNLAFIWNSTIARISPPSSVTRRCPLSLRNRNAKVATRKGAGGEGRGEAADCELRAHVISLVRALRGKWIDRSHMSDRVHPDRARAHTWPFARDKSSRAFSASDFRRAAD